jgi:hypothetical protein
MGASVDVVRKYFALFHRSRQSRVLRDSATLVFTVGGSDQCQNLFGSAWTASNLSCHMEDNHFRCWLLTCFCLTNSFNLWSITFNSLSVIKMFHLEPSIEERGGKVTISSNCSGFWVKSTSIVEKRLLMVKVWVLGTITDTCCLANQFPIGLLVLLPHNGCLSLRYPMTKWDFWEMICLIHGISGRIMLFGLL